MTVSKFFLTGATGFIGGQLTNRLLSIDPQTQIWVLIRDSRQLNAKTRFEHLLTKMEMESGLPIATIRNRLHLVVGDLTTLRFGLSETEFNDLASQINQIHHCAASINLIGDLAPIRRINYFGTQQVLELARIAYRNGHFKRLNYLSTAYIAGKRFGVIYEKELTHNKGFCNNYEKAKHETEMMVEAAKQELPITIFRPSIVMGDSKTGKTTSFNVIYEPMRLAYMGLLRYFPSSSKSLMDVVPVDYVCDAIIALSAMEEQTIGQTFHLTAGENQGMYAHQIALASYEHVKVYSKENGIGWEEPFPKSIHPQILMYTGNLMIPFTKGKKKRLVEKVVTYSKYAYYYKTFNTQDTDALLRPIGITPPKLSDYLGTLCDYAIQQNFGRKKQIAEPVLK